MPVWQVGGSVLEPPAWLPLGQPRTESASATDWFRDLRKVPSP